MSEDSYYAEFRRWAAGHRLRACTLDHGWVRSRVMDIRRAALGGEALHFARCIIVPLRFSGAYTPVFYRYGTPIPFLEVAVAHATMICPDPVVMVRVPLRDHMPKHGHLYIWQAIKHMEAFPDGYEAR